MRSKVSVRFSSHCNCQIYMTLSRTVVSRLVLCLYQRFTMMQHKDPVSLYYISNRHNTRIQQILRRTSKDSLEEHKETNPKYDGTN